nr:TPA_asm: hypothetical protein [Triaenono virus 1]
MGFPVLQKCVHGRVNPVCSGHDLPATYCTPPPSPISDLATIVGPDHNHESVFRFHVSSTDDLTVEKLLLADRDPEGVALVYGPCIIGYKSGFNPLTADGTLDLESLHPLSLSAMGMRCSTALRDFCFSCRASCETIVLRESAKLALSVYTSRYSTLRNKSVATIDEFYRVMFRLSRSVSPGHLCSSCYEGGTISCAEFPSVYPNARRFSAPGPRSRFPFPKNINWSDALNLLSACGFDRAVKFLESLDFCCVAAFKDWAGKITPIAKASVNKVPECTVFVDIGRWLGYLPAKGPKQLSGDTKVWLGTPHPYAGNCRAAWVVLCLCQIFSFIDEYFYKQVDGDRLLLDFLSGRSWTTNGACDPLGFDLTTSIGSMRLNKTKNVKGATIGSHELLRSMYSFSQEEIKILPKLEPGKQRHICRSDDSTYLWHALHYNLLHSASSRTSQVGAWSPLFCNHNVWVEKLRSVQNMVNSHNLMLPLDHSKFDEHQDSALILCIMSALIGKGRSLSSLHPAYLDWVALSYARAAKLLVGGKQVGSHAGGLPSGWKLTSTLNTLLNMSLNRAAYQLSGLDKFVRTDLFMGDDSLAVIDIHGSGRVPDFLRILDCVGYDLNATKNYAAVGVTDFLGYNFSSHGISGAASRSICSLIFYNPNQSATPANALNISGILMSWFFFWKRVSRASPDCLELFNCIRRDLCHRAKCEWTDLAAYIGTPTVVGGLGFPVDSQFGQLLGLRGDVPMRLVVLRSPAIYTDQDVSLPLDIDSNVPVSILDRAQTQYLINNINRCPELFSASLCPGVISLNRCADLPYGPWLPPASWDLQVPGVLFGITRQLLVQSGDFMKFLSPSTQSVVLHLRSRGISKTLLDCYLLDDLPQSNLVCTDGDEIDAMHPLTLSQDEVRMLMNNDRMTLGRLRSAIFLKQLTPGRIALEPSVEMDARAHQLQLLSALDYDYQSHIQ